VPELNILELHESLKIFPRISPLLIMRRTKQTYDACVEICKEINKLRDEQEFDKTDHIVKFGQKNRVKYRKIVNGLTK